MDKKIIMGVIDCQAVDRGDRVAIESSGCRLTYSELRRSYRAVAGFLVDRGLGKGGVVGIYLPASAEYISAVLGIGMAGGIFLPLSGQYPRPGLRRVIGRAEPEIFITDRSGREGLLSVIGEDYGRERYTLLIVGPGAEWEVEEFGKGLSEGRGRISPAAAAERSLPAVEGDDSSYLIYTSGSTGEPKMIEGIHKSLSHFIHWEIGEFGCGEGTRVSLLAPVSFDVSFRDIFMPLAAGGTVCIPEASDRSHPGSFLAWVGRQELTMMHMVPSLFRSLLGRLEEAPAERSLLRSVRYILLAGEPLLTDDVNRWRKLGMAGTELVNLYGPSETTLAKLFNRVEERAYPSGGIIPLGIAISNTSVLILNRSGRMCNIGEIGEIHIRSPFMSRGYYGDAVLTKEKFIQNPLHGDFVDIVYRTGDMGKYLEDGKIGFSGRLDGQVKIRGNRVETGEVELRVRQLEGIEQAVVLAVTRPGSETALACYYTVRGDAGAGMEKALTVWLGEQLPEYMIPSYFIRMESLPLNLNGKIDRGSLPSPEEMLYEQLEYREPSTVTESAVAEIWKEVLGLKRVGVDNTFFELGGHSLNATRVISQVYRRLGKEITLKEFLDHPTIGELGRVLDEKSVITYYPIEASPEQHLYDISYAQKRILLTINRYGENTLYNMPLAFRFTGPLDITVFQEAFGRLIDRHESLRTTFQEAKGEMKQRIHADIGFSVPVLDAAGQTEQTTTRKMIDELINEELDLEKGPLVSAKLVRLRDNLYLFLFNIHHVISDGWSLGVLVSEFVDFYNQIASGSPYILPPLPIQYKDYVYWLNSRIAAGRLARSRKFWHSVVENIPVFAPDLSDRIATPATGHRGQKHTFHFSLAESERMRIECAQQSVSLTIYLLAVIYILLFKRSGQRQITVGVPVAGRMHPDLQNQVGNYMNNLVLSVEIKEEDSWADFLARIKAAAFDIYDHQEYPYDLLVEERKITATWQNPFYNVLVVMNNEGLISEKDDLARLHGDITIEAVKIEEEISKLDLSFFCYDKPEISIAMEYNVELFREETMEKMESIFRQIHQLISRDRKISVHDLVGNISGEQEKDLKHKMMLHNTGALNEMF